MLTFIWHTYFKLLYTFTGSLNGVVCFISWCGWLSRALQVCKGHKRVQEPKSLLGCWELQTSSSSKFSSLTDFLPPLRETMSPTIKALWCGVQKEVFKVGKKVKKGQTVVSWDFCLLCFSAKECVFNLIGRGPFFLLYHPSLHPAFVHPGIQANKFKTHPKMYLLDNKINTQIQAIAKSVN